MRVLFVMTGADVGGAERLVAMLGRNWPREDTTRLVVLLGKGTLSSELEASFEDVRYLDIDPASRRIDRMVRGVEAQIADFAADVVASHMFHADLVVALARTRAARVTTVHTQAFGPKDLLLTKAIARAVGFLSFRFDAVVPSSDSADMQSFLRRLRMRRVVAPIPNATEIPARATFDPGSRAVVSIARNHPVKGQPLLLEAFTMVARQHPDWRLRLVGPGVTASEPPFDHLLAAGDVRRLHSEGRITLEGPTTEPGTVLDASSALVISSPYGEANPMVGLEAGARGIPVITTRVGSCPSFVDDPQFVVNPGDVPDLARGLDTYMALDDADRLKLSQMARARAEREYEPRVAASRYRAVFADAVARRVP